MFTPRLSRFRKRLSFANVTSAIALFVALGGTSYAAITLPTNSVGKAQIRADAVGKSEAATNSIGRFEIRSSGVGRSEIATNAVGASEVRPNAIDTDEIADGKIEAGDISDAAKVAINGIKFHAGAAADGTGVTGNAKSITKATSGPGVYTVDLGQDVSACQYAVTITGADAGFGTATQDATHKNVLTINTFAAAGGAAADRAFNLLVAC
jgi:hypothetical protein